VSEDHPDVVQVGSRLATRTAGRQVQALNSSSFARQVPGGSVLTERSQRLWAATEAQPTPEDLSAARVEA